MCKKFRDTSLIHIRVGEKLWGENTAPQELSTRHLIGKVFSKDQAGDEGISSSHGASSPTGSAVASQELLMAFNIGAGGPLSNLSSWLYNENE